MSAPNEGMRLARQAYDLTSDLMAASRTVYWIDLLATAAVTYASFAMAVRAESGLATAAWALLCLLALYRGISFIHEITHLRPDDVPGFRLGWNLLIGVPALTPSLMYEGVHNLHHAKTRYGTANDPEYLPLSHYPPAKILIFILVPLLAPLGVALRFGIIAPLTFVSPKVRVWATRKVSALTINPAFARTDVDQSKRLDWRAQELACWAWSWGLAGGTMAGWIPLRVIGLAAAIFAGMTFINQLRTVVAHAWLNESEPMSFEEQFLDSVNVPPPALLPLLWAPVGLRYHALHHLLPRLPYHNLGKAHARLAGALPASYRSVEQKSLTSGLMALLQRSRSAMARRADTARAMGR
ncbi:fatty acid desaturase [Phenylobacterium koreense]|uniref:Fatty acid desaturase n=1 Tax=Phenylobacterium koreense TaxID=266125 RepID=A0ABV2ELZ0_9CAUL